MSRNNSMYKDAFNRSLDHIGTLKIDAKLPAENELSRQWQVSRTTIRAVLTQLNERKVILWEGRQKTILRHPKKRDYFAQEETISTRQRVESQFMEYILGGDLKPGTILRESDLVREFGASTSAVREFLIQFSRFGLIEKKPNRHWVLRGFTREFAIELFDMREMFEFRAFNNLLAKGPNSQLHHSIIELEAIHIQIVENIDDEYLKFPRLDVLFHRILINDLNNRFVESFFDLISVIFHYHYRWEKLHEKERILAGAIQHLHIINMLKQGDHELAIEAFKDHLQLAKKTLLESVLWDE